MRRVGCQKATTELSLQNLQSLSHLHYPTDTRQLTSSQGEADGVSDRGMTLQVLGGLIRLVVGTASEGSSLLPEDKNTHTLQWTLPPICHPSQIWRLQYHHSIGRTGINKSQIFMLRTTSFVL
jgi:hypothetical protein